MSFFSIPGTVKNAFLPFLLNPFEETGDVKHDELAQYEVKLEDKFYPKIDNGTLDKDCKNKQQLFSFKDCANNQMAFGKIQIYPKSFDKLISQDISYKSLYDMNINSYKYENFELNSLLNKIPCIQIREFLPDTRLDQTINMMSEVFQFFKNGYSSLIEKFSKEKEDNKQTNKTDTATANKDFFEKLKALGKNFQDFGEKLLNFILNGQLFNNFNCVCKENELLNVKNVNNEQNTIYRFVLDFPYKMWYGLQSSVTMNMYELPCITADNVMYSSDGTPGWPSAGISMSKTIGEYIDNKVIKTAINSLFSNVNISFMPWWNGAEGNATQAPKVSVKLSLFNDNIDSALINFIFVNTIVPNARWLQYNLFQHSPCLYDIKLVGYKRLYACTGQFKVIQQGVLREMPSAFFQKLKKHLNPNIFKTDLDCANLLHDKIKIPDVYNVEMEFSSLLPDTFNNFIYQYVKNKDIIKEYVNSNISSDTDEILSQMSNDITNYVNTYKFPT